MPSLCVLCQLPFPSGETPQAGECICPDEVCPECESGDEHCLEENPWRHPDDDNLAITVPPHPERLARLSPEALANHKRAWTEKGWMRPDGTYVRY